MSTVQLTRRQLFTVISLALALTTLLLYWPVTHNDFVSVDDPQYIAKNAHVQAGLTWPGIVWAFRNTEIANWHPVTWISHMADCQLFGLNPGGHHLMNVLFHVANTLLLFLLLNELTGAVWRSALVAALFAWHPLHVESVAWAAERKDVLSAFFWMLTLLAYVRFAQTRSWPSYFAALIFFACGLMSKPMVVTLPFVLLLLDFWPIQRFNTSTIQRLILEKIPFFALAAAASVVTYLVQKNAGATWSLSLLPIHARLSNALISYVRYISKTLWPCDLAVIYPYQQHWPLILVMGAALLLVVWSGLFIWRAKQNPYLLFGWLWFLGTLVPAIGLVQVGAASMADRYTYIPGIGLFIIAIWGLNDYLAARPGKRIIAALIGMLALGGCLMATSIQLKYWANSATLFAHTVEVTTDNYTACDFLGGALDELGRKDEALIFYAESVRIESHFPLSQYNLGMALLNRGEANAAAEHLAVAARLVPNDTAIRFHLGEALMICGKSVEAAAEFSEALRLKPDFAEAHRDLAVALTGQNKIAEAIPQYREAVRLKPDYSEAKNELDEILAAHPEFR